MNPSFTAMSTFFVTLFAASAESFLVKEWTAVEAETTRQEGETARETAGEEEDMFEEEEKELVEWTAGLNEDTI